MGRTRPVSVFDTCTLSWEERNDILQTFRTSGLHGKVWRRGVYCIVYCKADKKTKYCYGSRNCNGQDAEEHSVRVLLAALGDDDVVVNNRERHIVENVSQVLAKSSATITMFINLSPCFRCSDSIRSLMQQELMWRGITLTIVTAALYKIRRPSCSTDCEHRLPSWAHHRRNVRGLQSLRDVGVEVRCFNSDGMQDWETLKHLLQLTGQDRFKYGGSDRQSEDQKMEQDLQDVLRTDEQTRDFPFAAATRQPVPLHNDHYHGPAATRQPVPIHNDHYHGPAATRQPVPIHTDHYHGPAATRQLVLIHNDHYHGPAATRQPVPIHIDHYHDHHHDRGGRQEWMREEPVEVHGTQPLPQVVIDINDTETDHKKKSRCCPRCTIL